MNIAIVGAQPRTKMQAPYDDPEWEIWACSWRNWKEPIPRWDLWFELHDINREKWPKGYTEFVQGLEPERLYITDPRWGHGTFYPKAKMESMWGPFFFTSTIAHMMALALSEEPKRLALWGVHQATNAEHEYQRQGCQYFVQMAWNRGVEVIVPEESSLLKPIEANW